MKNILRHAIELGLVVLVLVLIVPGNVLPQAPIKIGFPTSPSVSQFWTYPPDEYLKMALYTREYPPCKHC